MSAIPYSQMPQDPLVWKDLDQVKADLNNARSDQKGNIVIRDIAYPIDEIAKRIYSFRPSNPFDLWDCFSMHHPVSQNRNYLEVAKTYKKLANVAVKRDCKLGFVFCFNRCLCTSSCKKTSVLADSYQTLESLYGSDVIKDYQTFAKMEAPQTQTMTTNPEGSTPAAGSFATQSPQTQTETG